MSPLPRLHHHDIMTIVGLFTYRQYVIYIIYMYRSYVRNVGALKVANLHRSRQQCIVVEGQGVVLQLGLGLGLGSGNGIISSEVCTYYEGMCKSRTAFFPSFFFFSV